MNVEEEKDTTLPVDETVDEEVDDEVETTEGEDEEGESPTPPADTTEDESEEADESDEDEESEDDEKPKKGGVQKRIDELTAARRAAEQRAEAAEQQLQEARRKDLDARVDSAKPRIEDYDDAEEFERDYERWHNAKMRAYQKQEEDAKQRKQQEEQERSKYNKIMDKSEKALSKYPDFTQVVFDPAAPSLRDANEHLPDAVLESEKFADLSYYLAKNPSVIRSFEGLSPIQVGRKIAQLESKFEKKAQHKPSEAPTPAPKSGGRKSKGSERPSDKDSVSDWMQKRQREIDARRARSRR